MPTPVICERVEVAVVDGFAGVGVEVQATAVVATPSVRREATATRAIGFMGRTYRVGVNGTSRRRCQSP